MLQNHSDGEIREHIAEALGKIGDKKAIDILLTTLKNDKEDWVRGQAAEALGLIGDDIVIKDLIECLENDRGMGVSGNARRAFPKVPPDSVFPAVRWYCVCDRNILGHDGNSYASCGPARVPTERRTRRAARDDRRCSRRVDLR